MSDKLFKATARNHLRWISEGAVDAEFYIIAPDFMSAMVKADEAISALRERLAGHKSTDGLRLTTLSELGDVVDGVAIEREPQTERWIDREARKLRDLNA